MYTWQELYYQALNSGATEYEAIEYADTQYVLDSCDNL